MSIGDGRRLVGLLVAVAVIGVAVNGAAVALDAMPIEQAIGLTVGLVNGTVLGWLVRNDET